MPYKSPDKQRQAKAESARRTRAAKRGTCVEPTIPVTVRLQTARDVLALIEDELANVRGDGRLKSAERARTVGYLASIALRAVEQADLAARVESIERALRRRRGHKDGR